MQQATNNLHRILAPRLVVTIGTTSQDGRKNIIPINNITSISTDPGMVRRPGKSYPFPISYMTYYWATTDQPLQAPTGEEILESGGFSIGELDALNTPDQPVIEAGWKAYAGSYG